MKIQRIDDLVLVDCPSCRGMKALMPKCEDCHGDGLALAPYRRRDPIVLPERIED